MGIKLFYSVHYRWSFLETNCFKIDYLST